MRDGDVIEIVDSAAHAFIAAIALDGELVRATILEPAAVYANGGTDESMQFDVAQALPKGAKMDFVVEKTTELGVGAILPFTSERTVAAAGGDAKLARWRRLAKTAAQQCGRRRVPQIHPTMTFEALLRQFARYDRVLFPWELAERAMLRERLPQILHAAKRALIVIGPEGGFSHREAEAARAAGAELVWLGPRILRTETAALALLAIAEALMQGRNSPQARRTGA